MSQIYDGKTIPFSAAALAPPGPAAGPVAVGGAALLYGGQVSMVLSLLQPLISYSASEECDGDMFKNSNFIRRKFGTM